MIYIISYFQAGSNKSGSTHSNSIGWMSFEDKICFDTVRKTIKKSVQDAIESVCVCVSELRIFYIVVRIENDKVTGRYVRDIKSTNVLKWKTK